MLIVADWLTKITSLGAGTRIQDVLLGKQWLVQLLSSLLFQGRCSRRLPLPRIRQNIAGRWDNVLVVCLESYCETVEVRSTADSFFIPRIEVEFKEFG